MVSNECFRSYLENSNSDQHKINSKMLKMELVMRQNQIQKQKNERFCMFIGDGTFDKLKITLTMLKIED